MHKTWQSKPWLIAVGKNTLKNHCVVMCDYTIALANNGWEYALAVKLW